MEITDCIESYQRKYRRKLKERLIANQLLAQQIIDNFVPFLVEKVPDDYKKIQLWDVYPDLFQKEKDLYEAETDDREFESFKEKRRQFAARHNIKMNRGDDS